MGITIEIIIGIVACIVTFVVGIIFGIKLEELDNERYN